MARLVLGGGPRSVWRASHCMRRTRRLCGHPRRASGDENRHDPHATDVGGSHLLWDGSSRARKPRASPRNGTARDRRYRRRRSSRVDDRRVVRWRAGLRLRNWQLQRATPGKHLASGAAKCEQVGAKRVVPAATGDSKMVFERRRTLPDTVRSASGRPRSHRRSALERVSGA